MARLLELEPNSLFGAEAILTSLSGREEISRPFEFSLTIASPKENIKPEDVIGQALAVRIDRIDEKPRYIHGYISHLWAGDFGMSHEKKGLPSRTYRVRLVPWLWFMSRAARCFVYLPQKAEKSIQDVFDAVIARVKEYGHVETWHDAGNASILKSRKVEHCVQYRETDFNFLSRTLERYGVYYYFDHKQSEHKLILSDKSNYPSCVESEIEFPHSIDGQTAADHITSWEHSYEFVAGKWEQLDYDFLQPSVNLKVNATKHAAIPLKNNSGYELYDYSNDYVQKGDGRNEATRRMEEEEIRFNSVSGTSTCKTMAPGYGFKLKKHRNCPSEQGGSYVITSISHSAAQPGPFTSGGTSPTYSNQFTCVPREMQYRAPRHTPQPLLSSVQTAVVVGPKGEEIYTDEHGRVKVQFHWDREGKRDENTSCWLRVVQVHSGKSFGGIDIPRMGEEVVVSFIEGDPDRPIITGRVYHKESMPPFALPGEKTRSGMKTKTYKGTGYNELSMDDTPGKEQIRMHGQYNLDTVIEHDETHTIHNNRTKQVDVDETMTIGKNQKLDVGSNKTVTVGKDHSETVGKNQTVSVGSDQSNKIGSNQSNTIGSNQSTKVQSSSSEQIGKTKSIDAGDQITLTCGSSKLIMKKDGTILLQGKDITVKGSGKILAKASGDMILKGAKIAEN